jgi:hypothetical protein
MPQIDQHRTYRSLMIYGLLLNLYPQDYLRRHRAEMLLNFEDFESASSSKAALWLFIGQDLLVSVISIFAESVSRQITKSFWRQTVIVLIVLAVLLSARRGHTGEHFIWAFCYGYISGWFIGWWRKDRQASPSCVIPTFLRTFWGQTIVIGMVLAIIVAVARNHPGPVEHAIWVLCYGYMLGWSAGWMGKRRQLRL